MWDAIKAALLASLVLAGIATIVSLAIVLIPVFFFISSIAGIITLVVIIWVFIYLLIKESKKPP